MSKIQETPWYSRGETGEYLRDWADFLLHGDAPDALGFAKKAKRVGLTDAEVNQVLREELEIDPDPGAFSADAVDCF